jgi:hypothetical protein
MNDDVTLKTLFLSQEQHTSHLHTREVIDLILKSYNYDLLYEITKRVKQQSLYPCEMICDAAQQRIGDLLLRDKMVANCYDYFPEPDDHEPD